MSEHSPEPWIITSNRDGWFAVHAADEMTVGLFQVLSRDMKRIIACVNACRGLQLSGRNEDPRSASEPECCGKCRFWFEQKCRRYPTVLCASAWDWPPILASRWCGEFKEIVKP